MLIEMFKKKLNKECSICEHKHEMLYLITNQININFVVCEKCKNKLALLLQENKKESILLSTGEIY